MPSRTLAAPSSSPPPGVAGAPARAWVLTASAEQVMLAASVYWAATANGPFFAAALRGRSLAEPAQWGWLAALAVALTALHLLLLALVANRWTVRPLVALVTVMTAAAAWFMDRYGVYVDPSMVRNVLHTNLAEAREFAGASLLLHLALYALPPLLLLSRVRIVGTSWRRAALVRAGTIVGAAVLLVLMIVAAFQPLAALMRNQREARYLITPANMVWSLASVALGQARAGALPRQPIGLDAAPGASWAAQTRPQVLVLVVGETARAANWGLSGYARATTPQLARWPLVNFADVTACGTNTEVSLPCMFAPTGRRAYDEARVRGSESLLHVLARAGVAVHWRDNQSGCKGVCEGLAAETVKPADAPALCAGGRCFDAVLGADLERRLSQAAPVTLLVLHAIGNHGPSYHRRYPAAFKRFTPACEDDDLSRCSTEAIVNAYDNALLYTDHVLADLIARLHAQRDRVDSALLYVSDHGESLGERNLYLHGLPYAIAPAEQLRVPMVFWASDGFARSRGLDLGCLAARATQPASHDHLFHTVLGLLDVRTALHEPQWDLTRGCLGAPTTAGATGAAAAGPAPAAAHGG